MNCCNCDNKAIHMHHVVPRHLGGSDRSSNLVPICADCHSLVHDVKLTSNREAIKRAFKKRKEAGLPVGQSRSFDPEDLFLALTFMKIGSGLYAASKESGIPKTTLHRYAKRLGYTRATKRAHEDAIASAKADVLAGMTCYAAGKKWGVSESCLRRFIKKRAPLGPRMIN